MNQHCACSTKTEGAPEILCRKCLVRINVYSSTQNGFMYGNVTESESDHALLQIEDSSTMEWVQPHRDLATVDAQLSLRTSTTQDDKHNTLATTRETYAGSASSSAVSLNVSIEDPFMEPQAGENIFLEPERGRRVRSNSRRVAKGKIVSTATARPVRRSFALLPIQSKEKAVDEVGRKECGRPSSDLKSVSTTTARPVRRTSALLPMRSKEKAVDEVGRKECGRPSGDLKSVYSASKSRWKIEEDAALYHALMATKIGPSVSWDHIAEAVPGRSAKQCRERYVNHLAASVKKDPWTPLEDALLYHTHRRLGSKWAAISRLLPGRTDNSVKNHYNRLAKAGHKDRDPVKHYPDFQFLFTTADPEHPPNCMRCGLYVPSVQTGLRICSKTSWCEMCASTSVVVCHDELRRLRMKSHITAHGTESYSE